MNQKETMQILFVLETAYPVFYKNQSEVQRKAAINLWQYQFDDVEFDIVFRAVQALIATRTESFPPNIGNVKDTIQKITEAEISPDEAWRYVKKALQQISQFDDYEWERLPETVREAVTADQLRSWGYDENFNEAVISSNFMRNYSARLKNRREYRMYTPEVKKLVDEATEKLRISVEKAYNTKRISYKPPMLIGSDSEPVEVVHKEDFARKLREIHEAGKKARSEQGVN